jgi:metal-sulfur cluster biosynthetic enzyme
VYDPELDESVTALGFVERLEVEGSDVAVRFRLPTYWCAPNFAFLMARDIRDCISRLAWVRHVEVRLVDHCTSDAINDGLAAGRSFDQVFPDEAAGELAELRLTFRRKAFMARQERLLKHLVGAGRAPESLITLTLDELRTSADLGIDGDRLRARYLAIREELGLSSEGSQRAITTVDGEPLASESFDAYLRTLRTCRLNMEIGTHFCRGLLQVRYGLPPLEPPSTSDSEATAPGPGRDTRVVEPLRWIAGSGHDASGRPSGSARQ